MTLDPTRPRKSYNPFDSDDDTLDSPGLKSENVYTKEDGVGFDLKAFDQSTNALTFHMDNGDFLWEEAVFGQPAVNASANGHTRLSKKDGQLYTDENVTEYDLPDFIVCYKESTYQSVKDISVDEGVPTDNKIWVQSSEDQSKDSSSFLALSNKNNDAMNVEKDSDELNALEAPKSKLGDDHQNKANSCSNEDASIDSLNEEVQSGRSLVHEFGDDDSLQITDLKLVEDQASLQTDLATMAVETASGGLVYDVVDIHPAAETNPNKNASEQIEPDLTGKNGYDHNVTVEKREDNISVDKVENIVVQEATTGEAPSNLSIEHGEVKVKPDEAVNEEETLPESSKHEAVQESAFSSDSNSSTNSDPGKLEDKPQNFEVAKLPLTQTMTRHEEGTSSSSVVASQEARIHGETSFSASVPVPQPSSITFLGPVVYSGSISLRSESSAGSTRSFAFPVLQTEWNSSPVRMAKADQRHYRKRRGWLQALICCYTINISLRGKNTLFYVGGLKVMNKAG